MAWIRCLTLFGLTVLMTGCVTNLMTPLSNSATPNNTNGVVAVSVINTSINGVGFVLHNKQTGVDYTLSLGKGPTHREDAKREVIGAELPPGEYQITQWETFKNFGKSVYTKFDITNPYMAVPFTLQAGQVMYLGDYLVEGIDYQTGIHTYTVHWHISPLHANLRGAHKLFAGAYPAYANSALHCLMCGGK